jgi:3-dehydroquinate dehydratase-2
MLGTREPGLYGADTLASIEKRLIDIATKAKHSLVAYQSNAEHELIDRIQRAPADKIDFILFNPGGFTHTSVALRDALLAVKVPFIEVHLSNVHAREAFRRQSFFSDIAVGSITGFGALGYEFALRAAMTRLDAPKS